LSRSPAKPTKCYGVFPTIYNMPILGGWFPSLISLHVYACKPPDTHEWQWPFLASHMPHNFV
jgi:hypothetical protein